MISWPGHLPEDAVRDQVAHACDWMPTLAELCGVKLLDNDIDGKSLVRVIRSAEAPTPHDVLHWQVGTDEAAQWAAWQGDWKLIGNVTTPTAPSLSAEDKRLFLVNLAADISERHSAAKELSDIVQRLLKLHRDWAATQRQPMPKTVYRDKPNNER